MNIESIKEALGKITQGEWEALNKDEEIGYTIAGERICHQFGREKIGELLFVEDAKFTASAPTMIRFLLGEVDRLENALLDISVDQEFSHDVNGKRIRDVWYKEHARKSLAPLPQKEDK